MPVHQFFKMISQSLTTFAVNRNHVSTIVSEVEILSSFARDLCNAPQQFVYSSESSIQRSEQSVFVVSLENPFTTGSPIESSISCSFWTKVQWEFRTTAGTDLQTSQVKMSLRECHTFVPNLCAIQLNSKLQPSFHSSQFQPSFQEVSVGNFCADSCVSELASDFEFQDLRDQFSIFCLCVSLRHFWFLWIYPCFLYSCLCPHS